MVYLIIPGVILLTLFSPLIIKKLKHRSLYPMFPKDLNFGKRERTFREALRLLELRQAKVLVETGIARAGLLNAKSDGASTIVFGTWAKKHGAKLHSVDIDGENVRVAEEAIRAADIQSHVSTHIDDSVHFLANFTGNIDFLYLDSYDYVKHNRKEQENCQIHHLNEFKAAEDKLHKNSVVLIDDCRLKGGGKGKLVLEYMETQGWKRVISAYQVLLVQS